MSKIQKFAAISKVEDNADGTITVFGVASTEAVDAHGEIVTKSAMENALPDFFKYGTGALRSMHQPIAAGVVTKATVNDAGETEIEATVVDENEVKKVKAGVYKGFSIGGNQVPGGYDKLTKTITALKLTEISLVDRPANPEAVISMWKFEDEPAATATVSADAAAHVDTLAEILNKGEISPERLIELAQEDIAKAKSKKDDEKDEDDAKKDEDDDKSDKDEDDDKDAKAKKDGETKKSDTVVAIKKGMYGVSRFAELIQSIGYLVSDAEWEADCEQDDSPVPAKLRAWLTAGATLFGEMAAEEINEFIEQFKSPEDTSAAVVTMDIEMSEQAKTLRKSLDDAAATGSLVGYLSITKAHMPENEVAALVLSDGFEKATTAVLARLAPESQAIAKLAEATATIAKLEAERDELAAKVAKFDAAPAASKAVLRVVVEKGVDMAETATTAKNDEPVLKADGSVDHEATTLAAIKKVHQTGGQRLLR